MVVTIDSVRMSQSSIRIDQLTLIRVIVSGDPTVVVVRVPSTEMVLPLHKLANGLWFIDAFGSTLGECTAEGIQIVATDGVTTALDTSLTLTVLAGDYPDPSKFIENLIVAHWDPSKANGTQLPEHACITDVKRVNRDKDWILILEGNRGVESRARGFYQNISYPVTIEINSKDRERSRYILREVDRIMELYWNQLGSNHFDYMEFQNKGRDVSMASAKIWKFIYNVTLMKVYEPKEGVT